MEEGILVEPALRSSAVIGRKQENAGMEFRGGAR